MGFIEEGRQLFQDFVAPEIRAIDVRLSAVEGKIDAFETRKNRNRNQFETRMDRNHTELMDTLRRVENYIYLDLLERLARVESRLQNVA